MLHTIVLHVETPLTAERAKSIIMVELNIRNREVSDYAKIDVIKATILTSEGFPFDANFPIEHDLS